MSQKVDSSSTSVTKRKWRIPLLIVLFVSSVVLVNVFFQIENWKRDLTVNHAKLEENSQDPTLRPLLLSSSISDVADLIAEIAKQHAGWNLESRENIDDTLRLHLTRKTPILRFTDDIHVRLFPIEAGTRVEAESRSRIGKGDLGQNPRNLRELVDALSPASLP